MDYERVCAANEVARGSVLAREINGRPVAVVHCEDGTYHAVADECTHQEIPLSEGTVDHVQNDQKVIEVYLGR